MGLKSTAGPVAGQYVPAVSGLSTANTAAAATNNTTLIQAALNAGGLVQITTPGIISINATLLIPSNTTWYIGRGVILVRTAGGGACLMARNSDAVNGNVNIKIVGEGVLYCNSNSYQAVYNANPTDCPYYANLYAANIPDISGSITSASPYVHGLYFENVNGLYVGDGLTIMQQYKSGIELRSVTNFHFKNITYYADDPINQNNGSTLGRDAVHSQGRNSFGLIEEQYGAQNDDFMCLNCRDINAWANTASGTGSITDVEFRQIYGKVLWRGGTIVHLYGGLDVASAENTSKGTCTITVAAPAVVTNAGHGLSANAPIFFTTSGALPTGLSTGVVYYVSSPTTNTFQVSATPGGAAITTTGTQSGTHTLFSAPTSNGFDLAPAITSIVEIASTGIYTATTATAHQMVPGQHFIIYGSNPVGFNTGGATYAVPSAGVNIGTVVAAPTTTTFTFAAAGGSGLTYVGSATLVRIYQMNRIYGHNIDLVRGVNCSAIGYSCTTDTTKNFAVIEDVAFRNVTGFCTSPTASSGLIGQNFSRLINSWHDQCVTRNSTIYPLYGAYNNGHLAGVSKWTNIRQSVPMTCDVSGGIWAGFNAGYETLIIDGVDVILKSTGASGDAAIQVGYAGGVAVINNGVSRQGVQLSAHALVQVASADCGVVTINNPTLVSPSTDTRIKLCTVIGAVTAGQLNVTGLSLASNWFAPMIDCFGVGLTINIQNNRLVGNVASKGGMIQYYNAGTITVNDLGNAYGAATLFNSSSTTSTIALKRSISTVQTLTSGAAPAVDCNLGNVMTLATGANATVTLGAPSNVPPAGERVQMTITQDATGGRTVAFNAAYIFPTAFSNTGNTANKKTTVLFVSDGTALVAQGANSWY